MRSWQYHDLADKSQSGYDLALAGFGVGIGMSRQQIADMIVHHRRLHGAARANTLDYFRRTISKAETRSVEIIATRTPPVPRDCAGSGSLVATIAEGPNGEAMRKSRLCEQISAAMGIRVIRILKLTGKDPVYFLDLEQGRVEFPSVRTLISYKTFREIIAAKTNRLIPPFKGKSWEQLAQTILDACIDIDGTDELQLEGEARSYISQYLSETQFLSSLDDPAGTLQRPIIRDETFWSLRLICRCSSTRPQCRLSRLNKWLLCWPRWERPPTACAVVLFREQSRWALPLDEFDSKDYANREGL